MLFSCSVRDNIAYGSPDPTTITDAEIIEAARKANAYNFINSFPQKFDTMVGERGLTLSGKIQILHKRNVMVSITNISVYSKI